MSRAGATSAGHLLAEPNFLRVWLAGACAATARWLEMLAVGIFVFEETGSPLLVAAMLMLRMLPLALFGAFGGEVASRFDRRRVLLGTLGALTALSGGLAGLAALGWLAVWHVAVGAVVTGVAWAMDFPVRRTLLADVAGNARLGAAMSLDTVASSGTRMAGPILGGGLYAASGMDGAFLLTAAAHGLAFCISCRCSSAAGPSASPISGCSRLGSARARPAPSSPSRVSPRSPWWPSSGRCWRAGGSGRSVDAGDGLAPEFDEAEMSVVRADLRH